MSAFKEGDKVRITNISGDKKNSHIGKVGPLMRECSASSFPWEVCGVSVRESEIEHVSPASILRREADELRDQASRKAGEADDLINQAIAKENEAYALENPPVEITVLVDGVKSQTFKVPRHDGWVVFDSGAQINNAKVSFTLSATVR